MKNCVKVSIILFPLFVFFANCTINEVCPVIQEDKNVLIASFRYNSCRIEDRDNLSLCDLFITNPGFFDSTLTYAELKAKNPDQLIFMYKIAPYLQSVIDDSMILRTNIQSIGRWNKEWSPPSGIINDGGANYADFIAKDASGDPILFDDNAGRYLLKLENQRLRDFFVQCIKEDLYNFPAYRSDGVFFNGCFTPGIEPLPAYDFDQYRTELSAFLNNISTQLKIHTPDWSVIYKMGLTYKQDDSDLWALHDLPENGNDILFDFGFVCIDAGGTNDDVQIYSHDSWKRSIDTHTNLVNCHSIVESRCQIKYGETGLTNFIGQSITGCEVLWYALGSYLIMKRTGDKKDYFYCNLGDVLVGPNDIDYFKIYDYINHIGTVMGTYYTIPSGKDGIDLYVRDTTNGFVVVNPNRYYDTGGVAGNEFIGISIPAKYSNAVEITEAMIQTDIDPYTQQLITSFDINANHAKFFYVKKINDETDDL